MDAVSLQYEHSLACEHNAHYLLFVLSDNDVTDVIENSFSVEDDRFGEVVDVELKPGGSNIEVTEENKKDYVDLITVWRIQRRVEDQFKSFMSGFNELIPQELINVFDERELEASSGYTLSRWLADLV